MCGDWVDTWWLDHEWGLFWCFKASLEISAFSSRILTRKFPREIQKSGKLDGKLKIQNKSSKSRNLRACALARLRASALARGRASARARKRASAQIYWFWTFFFEFSIFRPIFRPIFRTKFTHIFNTPPTCLVTPHLWSNHLALAQLTHKWPRNYQKTVFPADISDFWIFRGNFRSIFGSKMPKFPNLL